MGLANWARLVNLFRGILVKWPKHRIAGMFLHGDVVQHIGLYDFCNCLLSLTAGIGNLQPAGRIWPAKQNHPARSPFTNCSNCMTRLLVLHFMTVPSLQLLVLHA